jgi:SAM-dependent methyltransferase
MVEFLGLADGKEVVRAEHYWPDERLPALETPTDDLMQRVGGNTNKVAFRRSGFNLAAQLLAPVRTYREAARPPRILDWGCGPGRATQFLQSLWPGIELTGCDIDAEAIDWCRGHIPGVRFDATNPFPPLPYGDGAFDAVVSSSVMTHLGASVQLLWLDEIYRILAPDGILVTTVHGSFAARLAGDTLLTELNQTGIVDRIVDAALDGIAPADYYRATWQTEAYTFKNWTQKFAILEYREAGLDNLQDMVIMKRRRASRRWLAWLR